MSEQTIYTALRAGGLSPAGACAMMGNWSAESALISSNVEDRCTLGDHDYTYAVDTGTISRYQFKVDAYGYGLAQWTDPSRKEGLYDLARNKNVSIADEQMQCEFCLQELKNQWGHLYMYLCSTDDIAEAAKRICSEYEMPAVNNFAVRINAAQKYFNLLANDDTGCTEDSCPIEFSSPIEFTPDETCSVNVRVLHKGSLGRDVYLLQAGLFDMGFDCGMPDGDFGVNTESAVKQLQKANNVEETGTADWFVWQTVLSKR